MNRRAFFLAASALCAGTAGAHAQSVPTLGLTGARGGADAQSVVMNCLIATSSGTFAVPCGGDSAHPLYVTGGGGGGGTVTQGAGSSASPWSVQGTLSASILNWPAQLPVQDQAAISSLGTIATNTAPQSGNRIFTSCTVGTVSTQCLPALPGRRGLVVENHSGEAGAPTASAAGVTCTESTTATAFLGWVLQGNGGAFELELPNVIPAGAINCISNGGSPVTITLGQV